MSRLNFTFENYSLFERFIRISISTITLCITFNTPTRSQDNHINSYAPEAEKIYLQLDGKVYTTDKTIWFKSVVTRASDHNLTKLSGVLYVELIDPGEKILEKKSIKLENGVGNGFFPGIGAGLPPSVHELQDLGVARLSLGSSLMKATLALIKKVADELSENGTYNILLDTLTPLPEAVLAYKMSIGSNK